MTTQNEPTFVTEPEKRVPCRRRVDVAVAGGGCSGVVAALAAARAGARTVLVDRFGAPGGNVGPGMFVGGSFTGYPSPLYTRALAGIPRQWIEAHAAAGGGAVPPFSSRHYLRDSSIASSVALRLLVESGVDLMLSAFAADPLIQDGAVAGLFVESKSGREAVLASVVIDATGEADVARRAGAPIISPDPDIKEKGRAMGLYYVIGGVDWDQYRRAGSDWSQEAASGDDLDPGSRLYADLVRRAEDSGEYRGVREIAGLADLVSFRFPVGEYDRDGFASGYVAVNRPHCVDAGDGHVVARLETEMRLFAFDTWRFWKARVPGFRESYLLTVAPFLGSRGGPAVEGEYVMVEDDIIAHRQFSDVIYRYVRDGNWADIPYRVMVPKQLDGLLAVGRSASARPASLLRSRLGLMQMGQAGGLAAALAARQGIAPRGIAVQELQRQLLDAGTYLGDSARLRELGLMH